jgi:hypothetical protein
MRRHGKRKTDVHAGRISLYRSIEELFNLRECDDLIKLLLDLRFGHPQDRAVQKDILLPVNSDETRPYLQTRYSSRDLVRPLVGSVILLKSSGASTAGVPADNPDPYFG